MEENNTNSTDNSTENTKPKTSKSILTDLEDEYKFTTDEYIILHLFYITHCMSNSASNKCKSLIDYGWTKNNIVDSGAKNELQKIFDIENTSQFDISGDNKSEKSLDALKNKYNLLPSKLDKDFIQEKGFIESNKNDNGYVCLFKHIRNCLAHGRYKLVYSKDNVKMVIMEDKNSDNKITARLVLKLDTLIGFIHTIDKNNLLESELSL